MILAQKSTAVPVAFAKFKTTQPFAFVSLTAPKKTTRAARFAPTEMKPGEAIVRFIVNVASATPKMAAAQMLRTRTFTSITTENARNCR